MPTTLERSFRQHWKRKSEPHKGRSGEWQPVRGANFWLSIYRNGERPPRRSLEQATITTHRSVRRTITLTRSWQGSDRRMRDASIPTGWRLEGNYPQRPPATTPRQNELAMESRAEAVLPRLVRWPGSKVLATAAQWICQ